MSHTPLCYERLSPAAFAILQDAARERAVRLREEAIGAAASWLARAFADAVGRLARRVRRRQPHWASVWIASRSSNGDAPANAR